MGSKIISSTYVEIEAGAQYMITENSEDCVEIAMRAEPDYVQLRFDRMAFAEFVQGANKLLGRGPDRSTSQAINEPL